MMPKSIYETAPFIYLISGSYCLITSSSAVISSAGILLFFAGATIWIKRSQTRSRQGRHYPTTAYLNHDKSMNRPVDRYRSPYLVPSLVYEYLPFTYVLAGLFCYRYQQTYALSILILLAASLFILAGMCSWIMRGYFRGYHRHQSLSQLIN